jgi:DMSO reductase anchor subunit
MENYIPLLVFTLFGGIAAGATVLGLIPHLSRLASSQSSSDSISENPPSPSGILTITCLILLLVGLVATLLHLGQPLRFINGLSNPSSMISQESYWGLALFIFLALGTAFTLMKKSIPLALRVITALAGVGLMLVTALAYYQSRGIPAWHDATVIPFMIFGDLLLGAALCSALSTSDTLKDIFLKAALVLSCINVVSVCAFAIHIAGLDVPSQVLPLIVGSLTGLVAPAALVCMKNRIRTTDKTVAFVVLALVCVGVLLIRVAFFSSGVHL